MISVMIANLATRTPELAEQLKKDPTVKKVSNALLTLTVPNLKACTSAIIQITSVPKSCALLMKNVKIMT